MWWLGLSVLSLLSLTSTSAHSQCLSGYDYFKASNRCYKLYETPTKWSAAESQCKADGAEFSAGNRKDKGEFWRAPEWDYHAVVFKIFPEQSSPRFLYAERRNYSTRLEQGSGWPIDYVPDETLRRFACGQFIGTETNATKLEELDNAEREHLWEVLQELSIKDWEKQEAFSDKLKKTITAVVKDVRHQMRREPVRKSRRCRNGTGELGSQHCFKIFDNKQNKTVKWLKTMCRDKMGILSGVYAVRNEDKLYYMRQWASIQNQKNSTWRRFAKLGFTGKPGSDVEAALDEEIPEDLVPKRFVCLWGEDGDGDEKRTTRNEFIEHASLYIAFYYAETAAPEYSKWSFDNNYPAALYRDFLLPWENIEWWQSIGIYGC